MATAIGAVDLAVLAQGQKNPGMAHGAIVPVTRDARVFDFDHLNRFHDDVMSFNNNLSKPIADQLPAYPQPTGIRRQIDPLPGR